MIPRASITAWRKAAPWPDNTHPVAAVAGIASTLARGRPSRAEALGILGLG